MELPHLRQGVFECLGGSCARQWVEILVCCHGEGLEDGSIGRQGKGERDLGSRQSDVEQDYASRKNSRYCAVIWSNSIVYTIAARFLLSQWIFEFIPVSAYLSSNCVLFGGSFSIPLRMVRGGGTTEWKVM